MEQKIELLINVAAQKIVEIARDAREKQLHGFDADHEFCLLTRLQAIIFRLRHGGPVSLGELRNTEELLSNIGERKNFPFRPIVTQPNIEIKPKDPCCDGTLDGRITDLQQQVNYQPPTLRLTPVGLNEGTYEVGHGDFVIDVNWRANKFPLTVITIRYPENETRLSENLVGTEEEVIINLAVAEAVTRRINGFYNDRTAFRGTHLLAQDELNFRTVWPCYWGTAPKDAFDDAEDKNAFIRSLNRELECFTCMDIVIPEGHVFWYFYRHTGLRKLVTVENGKIEGSFKGIHENFRTQSMEDNDVPGGIDYGVIRTDHESLGCVRICIDTVQCPETNFDIEFPEEEVLREVQDPEQEDTITIEGSWSELVCTGSIE
ncbi:hypothetical protein [Mongoliitalea daihaiensis]|uniref:hypothetical protein n=1 Tax=Mongoliitalea daihaiensis TaxID=2782006 RepID=UPI001F33F02E|nr:hypothetical protein [Mongoliitalea daihaiensis]UJP63987.1 hypothetical protein IPZ59_14305 [Mongoliitalea daihaiensis]